jgi:hypothetical protein
MPAVVLELGAPHHVAMKTLRLAEAVKEALESWLTMSQD